VPEYAGVVEGNNNRSETTTLGGAGVEAGSSIDGLQAPSPTAPADGIVRTTVVSVSYAQEAAQGGDNGRRWDARGPGSGR
jgi:hypothetical protein